MNAMMDHIHVRFMLHVETQWVHMSATVILDSVRMVEVAVTLMNVMDHINVHLMPSASITLAHTLVSAILDLLEMEEVVHAFLDLLKMGKSAMT